VTSLLSFVCTLLFSSLPGALAVSYTPLYSYSPSVVQDWPEPEPYASPDLGLRLDVTPTYAYPGDPLTFTLALVNNGNLPLEGTVVSATVPAGAAAALAFGRPAW